MSYLPQLTSPPTRALHVTYRLAIPLLAVMALAAPLTLSGCSEDTPGCGADTDCRGGRICIDRVCQEPEDGDGTDNNGTDNNGTDNNVTNNAGSNNSVNNEPGNNASNNAPNNVSPECEVDGDCDAGFFCDASSATCEPGCRPGQCGALVCDLATRECVTASCEGDVDCADGEFCDEGACADGCREGGCGEGGTCNLDTRRCVFGACDGDGDCGDGSYCDEGVCTEGCQEGGCGDGGVCDLDTRECVFGACEGDVDCADGEFCEEGFCADGCREGGCGDGGTCDPDTRRCVFGACDTDGDCDDASYCDEGLCTQGCRVGGCPDGLTCDLDTRECLGDVCESDAACADGEFCDEGACAEGCRVGGCGDGATCDTDTRACEADPTGPEIEVAPESIDFGEVAQDTSAFEEVVVSNVGVDDLLVSEVRLQRRPSTGFQIIAPSVDDPVVIAPGESAVWRVRFEPVFLQGGDPTDYGNTVEIFSNDADEGLVGVPIGGVGVPNDGACLRFSSREVNFGFVAPPDVASMQVELVNCGADPLDVDDIALEGDEDAVFSTLVGGDFPRELGPGATINVVINYVPDGFGGHQASLIASAGDLLAESIVIAEGVGCPQVELLSGVGDQDPQDGDRIVTLGETVTIDGSGSSDPAGGELTYQWTVQAPEGSAATAPGEDTATFELTPDVGGTYAISLTVTSSESGLISCQEASLNLISPQLAVTLTWGDRSDLDLHVVRSTDGAFSEIGSSQDINPNDCYFANDNPDWGVEGDPTDDPSFLGDDTNGNGPETTVFPSLEQGRSYQIVVRMSVPRNFEDTNMTLTVSQGEEETVIESSISGRGTVLPVATMDDMGVVTPL